MDSTQSRWALIVRKYASWEPENNVVFAILNYIWGSLIKREFLLVQ